MLGAAYVYAKNVDYSARFLARQQQRNEEAAIVHSGESLPSRVTPRLYVYIYIYIYIYIGTGDCAILARLRLPQPAAKLPFNASTSNSRTIMTFQMNSKVVK